MRRTSGFSQVCAQVRAAMTLRCLGTGKDPGEGAWEGEPRPVAARRFCSLQLPPCRAARRAPPSRRAPAAPHTRAQMRDNRSVIAYCN